MSSDEIQIDDLHYLDDLTSNKGYWGNWSSSGATAQFTSNGLQISGSGGSNKLYPLNIQYPTDYSVEYMITALNRDTGGYIAEGTIEGISLQCNNSTSYIYSLGNWDTSVSYPSTLEVGDIIKFVKQSNIIYIYKNNVLLGSKTKNNSYNGFKINQYGPRGFTIKNLKIRQL